MDKWVPILENVQKCIVRIVLYGEGEIISEGSGTIINSSGLVLTAWHVVETCNYYITEKKDYSLFVFTPKGRFLYRLCNTQFILGVPLVEKENLEIEIDLAILEPTIPLRFKDYLSPVLSNIDIKMGSDLLICGYSEETPDFMDYNSLVAKLAKGESKKRLEKELKLNGGSMKPATYKSGILAHTTHIYATNPLGTLSIHMQYLHIDNGAHGGMSGGPIIDSQGRFVAILIQRTTVRTNIMAEHTLLKFEVPSGNSIGITLNYLESIFQKFGVKI